MPCHPSDFVDLVSCKAKRCKYNGFAAICKQQRCNHVRAVGKGYPAKTQRNFWTIAASYATIMPNYAATTPTSLRHFWLTWPGMCKKKNVAVQTCKLIPDNKSRNFRSDLCEVLPACIGINKSKMLSWLGWSEALKKVLKPSTPAPCIVLFRSNKKRRSRNSKIPQDWNCAAKRKGYF